MKTNAIKRGILAVRADAGSAQQILETLQRTFAEFKDKNDERLKGVEKKFDDVVAREQVDRINADLTRLQGVIEDHNRRMASLSVAEGAGVITPEAAEHRKAFARFIRKGVDADLRDMEIKAALRTDSDPDGGYVTPVELDQQITRVQGLYSSMRRLARVVPVGSATFKRLHNMGGATSGWVGETDARTETNTPVLKEQAYPTMELFANPATTQGILDDASVNIEAWLAEEVGIAFDEMEGAAFVSGNGVARPRGFLSYTAVANASYAWEKIGYVASGAAADFASSNPSDQFIDLIHALKPGYRQNATFLMNDLTLSKIRKFKTTTGEYLWQPSLQAGAPSQLLGYRVETDDSMPDVAANALSVAFADFRRGYIITDRMGVRVLRDPFSAKPYVMFYTTKRVGGGVQDFAAIKLMKIATS